MKGKINRNKKIPLELVRGTLAENGVLSLEELCIYLIKLLHKRNKDI